jgi:hypothetical protein
MFRKNGEAYSLFLDLFIHLFRFFKIQKLVLFISVSKVILMCCTPVILADQLPYPLQLFYLTPNNVGILPPYYDASNYMAVENTAGSEASSKVHTKQTSGYQEVIEGETSQFHSQDHKGRALFGYTTPDQARIESRSEDGTVRGSYSYLDAWGKAVKVRVILQLEAQQDAVEHICITLLCIPCYTFQPFGQHQARQITKMRV